MLKLQYKDHRKPAIWLVDSRYSIGRDKSNDIIINEDGVAGFHAELQVENDDRIFLTDAGSAGGTYVNGKPIKARTQLRANDSIRIGNVELSLLDPKEQLQKAGDENEATAMTPALQGLNADNNKPAVDTGSWLLRARTGSLVGKEYPVSSRDRLVIGRSKNCDVVLPSNHVSRQHAEVYFHGGKLYVKDLGSSNGTYVNRKKVQEGVVHNGDELRFDTLVFEVVAPEGVENEGDTTQFRAAVTDDMVNKPAGKPAPAPASQSATPARSATQAGVARTATQSAAARKAPAAGARQTAASAPAVGGAEAVQADGKGGGAGLWLVLVVLFLGVGGAAAWFLL